MLLLLHSFLSTVSSSVLPECTERLELTGHLLCTIFDSGIINMLCLNSLAHPLQQAGWVFTDVCEASDDVVQVEVTEGGVILALPPHLEETGGGHVGGISLTLSYLLLKTQVWHKHMEPTWFSSKYQQFTGESRFWSFLETKRDLLKYSKNLIWV